MLGYHLESMEITSKLISKGFRCEKRLGGGQELPGYPGDGSELTSQRSAEGKLVSPDGDEIEDEYSGKSTRKEERGCAGKRRDGGRRVG